jgi:hypothetical protein
MRLQRRWRLFRLACWSACALAAPLALRAAAPEDDWQPLFNGRDLSGWAVDGSKTVGEGGTQRPVWSAADGQIRCAGSGFGFLRYERRLSDFALRLEYRLDKDGNSGVGIRSPVFTGPAETRPSLAGYEIQLLDDAGQEPTDHSTGALYRYVAANESAARPAGEWNRLEIECRGPQIRITLNGRTLHDLDQTQHEAIAQKPLEGFISLQNHGSPAEFRRLELKNLAPRPAPAP